MSSEDHKKDAPSIRALIITVSDTRTVETDKSGDVIYSLLEDNSHMVGQRKIVKDEQEEIRHAIQKGIDDKGVDVVLLNGGTGISKRDVTYEVVEAILEKELAGFGELFRMISYTDDIGTPAMLSRAIGGVTGETAIFAMPGSSGAVKLAMSRLLLPELPHIVRELHK
ncbi:MogA/MoaB family molybdenum cofactor biosynthesis protein [Alkalihalobacillus hwajinpoensis]|uniref:MogA/MoaB family molybdenum cofactor biosynthesis protein n=1 Tax=Guptibacillus hwajinpoensis TaxID=208199 RepID=UPI001883C98F|nr:MogA/MoaB family molybdenum cofactor biosynthesis protein [Pseudalkalibacillus hwajinpoensis]MBF0706241.1 MogA/MoaB family molybdenum cofactor biosynthesis protein [Pseudalkalibacillus hwajinpoensis]